MCEKYESECGECVTRPATEQELLRTGRTEQVEIATCLDKPHAWWKDTENKLYGSER